MKQLNEKEAENFLEKNKFKVVKRQVIKEQEQLKRIKIKFPIVMKASGKNINHKRSMGGVILNVKTKEQAEKAFHQLKKIKGCQEIMIQPQLSGEELILGLKQTPEFGLVILLGKGGSNVEKEKDVSFRATPIDKKEVQIMFKELRAHKFLKNKINEKLLINNLLKFSKLAKKYKTKIQELDINPLIINQKNATIVDARIILN